MHPQSTHSHVLATYSCYHWSVFFWIQHPFLPAIPRKPGRDHQLLLKLYLKERHVNLHDLLFLFLFRLFVVHTSIPVGLSETVHVLCQRIIKPRWPCLVVTINAMCLHTQFGTHYVRSFSTRPQIWDDLEDRHRLINSACKTQQLCLVVPKIPSFDQR